MKAIRFEPSVPAEIRAIPRHIALTILQAIHRYASTGAGPVRSLTGGLQGFLRLRVGDHRVLFTETGDTLTVHRVADRRDAYR